MSPRKHTIIQKLRVVNRAAESWNFWLTATKFKVYPSNIRKQWKNYEKKLGLLLKNRPERKQCTLDRPAQALSWKTHCMTGWYSTVVSSYMYVRQPSLTSLWPSIFNLRAKFIYSNWMGLQVRVRTRVAQETQKAMETVAKGYSRRLIMPYKASINNPKFFWILIKH